MNDIVNNYTVSGNIPYETLKETNNHLQWIIRFLKSLFGISDEDIDLEEEVEEVKDLYKESLESGKEYEEKVIDSLNDIGIYIQNSVSGNDSLESGNYVGLTVSGNLPSEDFYNNVTLYMETSTRQGEDTLTYLKDIHGVSIVILCGMGIILGLLFSSNFSRWWKSGY